MIVGYRKWILSKYKQLTTKYSVIIFVLTYVMIFLCASYGVNINNTIQTKQYSDTIPTKKFSYYSNSTKITNVTKRDDVLFSNKNLMEYYYDEIETESSSLILTGNASDDPFLFDIERLKDPHLDENGTFIPLNNETAVRRYPQAVIIGFQKCGTRALLSAVAMHPYVVASTPELHFYDRDDNFNRGYGWYKRSMPKSYSDQITMEKTPSYALTQRAISQMKKKFPDIKLLVVVCNPVDRIISSYAQQAFKEMRDSNSSLSYPLERWYANASGINPEKRCVHISSYFLHLMKWFNAFDRKQILILDGAKLISDPLSVVKKVEVFLGVPPLLSSFNFVKSEETGYYCFRRFGHKNPECFRSSSKGRPHEVLAEEERTKLENYFRPYNRALFSLLNLSFDW